MFTFNVDENNTVWGFAPEQSTPCLKQPQKPNGEPWIDTNEATAWGQAWVNHMNDPENNPFPEN